MLVFNMATVSLAAGDKGWSERVILVVVLLQIICQWRVPVRLLHRFTR